jgi:hypothetical protein
VDGSGPAGQGRFTVGQADLPRIDGLGDIDVVGFAALIDWAVPALVLSVPGLLLLIVILAQMLGGLFWLPVARRWLGGFGLRRGRAAAVARPG